VIVQVGSVISSRKSCSLNLDKRIILLTRHAELYRKDDVPYYHLRSLNKRKARAWDAMSSGERVAYQADQAEREKDGNKRLDFRFQY
jgi:hypothetical protein